MNANNRLIAALPRSDQVRFLENCQSVTIASGETLAEPGKRVHHVYFPTTSAISVIAPEHGAQGLELAMIGDEGMLGAELALGVSVAPLGAVTQNAGLAWRMTAPLFRKALKENSTLRKLMSHYLYVSFLQLAQTAACTHSHLLEARLARWLLMALDRAQSRNLLSTQESLAYMLGVRRVGVTKAASALQNKKLIRYRRGQITILDRAGLEAISCQCYEADKNSYRRVLGRDPFR